MIKMTINKLRNLPGRQIYLACILSCSGGALSAHAADTGLRFYPMQLDYAEADSKGGVTVNVMSNSPQVFLLKGTVSPMDPETGRAGREGASIPPFVILHPLARLEAKGQYAFRVRQAGGALPQDRESACIISVTAIPGVSEVTRPPLLPGASSQAGSAGPSQQKTQGSDLQIALRMNMRLFYRPAGVPVRDNASVASKLIFRTEGGALKIENPTPYFVHFTTLSVAGQKVPGEVLQAYIPPKSSRSFSVTSPQRGAVDMTFFGDKEVRHAAISG